MKTISKNNAERPVINTGDLKIDLLMPELYNKWLVLPFEECLDKYPNPFYKLKKHEISGIGKLPVIDQGGKFISGFTNDLSKAYKGTKPLIIFGDHTQNIKYVDLEFAVGADGTKILHPKTIYNIRFFYHYLCSLNFQSAGYSRHYKYLKQIFVPLPPHNEQKRIAEKLDHIMTRFDGVKERLERIPQIIKRFRQSVLSAAVTGKLTEKWREENTKKINTATSSGIPESWSFVHLGKLSEYVTSGSRGWAKYYSEKGSIFIRAQNINTDKLLLDDVVYVQLPKNIEGKRTRIATGDLLITITGANVTKTALVEEDIGEAYVNQHVGLLRLYNKDFGPYLFVWLISPIAGRKQLEEAAYGAGKPGLNLQNIKDVTVNLPPIEEQREIVRQVDKLFVFADKLEDHYRKAKKKIEKLPQSVLAKAFRGELVPQNLNDEPAEKLLERIKEEKVRLESEMKKNRRKTTRKNNETYQRPS